MKKLFVMSIMLVVSFTLATAQQRQMGTPEERAKASVDQLSTLLTLTADQKTKIQAIEVDLNKQMDEKRQSSQGDRETMMAVFQEFQKAREEKYKAVLTADQYKKYQEDAAGRQQRGPGGGPGGQRNN